MKENGRGNERGGRREGIRERGGWKWESMKEKCHGHGHISKPTNTTIKLSEKYDDMNHLPRHVSASSSAYFLFYPLQAARQSKCDWVKN